MSRPHGVVPRAVQAAWRRVASLEAGAGSSRSGVRRGLPKARGAAAHYALQGLSSLRAIVGLSSKVSRKDFSAFARVLI